MAKKKNEERRVSRESGEIVFEVGDMRLRVEETTIRSALKGIVKHPLIRDTVRAVRNYIRPMDDDELIDFINQQRDTDEEDG